MANKKEIASNKQKDKLVEDLDKELERLDKSLGYLQSSIDAIQTGDGKQPFWNGENAYTIIKNCLSQLYSDSDLLNHLCQCRMSIKK